MADKKPVKSDNPLNNFIESGGRPDAEIDFNRILNKAVPAIKPEASKKK